MVGAGFSHPAGVVGQAFTTRRGVPLAKLAAAGVDFAQRTALSVTKLDDADVGEFELTWVDELDDECLVATAHRLQRLIPTGIEQVGDHHGEPATTRRAAVATTA